MTNEVQTIENTPEHPPVPMPGMDPMDPAAKREPTPADIECGKFSYECAVKILDWMKSSILIEDDTREDQEPESLDTIYRSVGVPEHRDATTMLDWLQKVRDAGYGERIYDKEGQVSLKDYFEQMSNEFISGIIDINLKHKPNAPIDTPQGVVTMPGDLGKNNYVRAYVNVNIADLPPLWPLNTDFLGASKIETVTKRHRASLERRFEKIRVALAKEESEWKKEERELAKTFNLFLWIAMAFKRSEVVDFKFSGKRFPLNYDPSAVVKGFITENLDYLQAIAAYFKIEGPEPDPAYVAMRKEEADGEKAQSQQDQKEKEAQALLDPNVISDIEFKE